MQHIHLAVATLIKAPRKTSGSYDPAKIAPQTSAWCSTLGFRVGQCYRWQAAERVGLCRLLLARHRSEPVYALIDGSERRSRRGNEREGTITTAFDLAVLMRSIVLTK
jgi:hypothetical protein